MTTSVKILLTYRFVVVRTIILHNATVVQLRVQLHFRRHSWHSAILLQCTRHNKNTKTYIMLILHTVPNSSHITNYFIVCFQFTHFASSPCQICQENYVRKENWETGDAVVLHATDSCPPWRQNASVSRNVAINISLTPCPRSVSMWKRKRSVQCTRALPSASSHWGFVNSLTQFSQDTTNVSQINEILAA